MDVVIGNPHESAARDRRPPSPPEPGIADEGSETALPLAGVRVLDLSTVMAGPFATHVLAEQGADLIKVEPPEGDIMRFSGRAPEPGMAPIYQHMNRGKRSIAIDLKAERGHEVLHRLVGWADVLVYNMRPRAMAKLGLSYANVRALKASIVYCGIVGYGQRGPYAARPAYDDLIQGAAGVARLTGRSTRSEPRFVPFAMCDRIAGLYAATAIVSALLRRERTGQGVAIEVPMFETSAHFLLVEHMFGRTFRPSEGEAVNPRMMEADRRPYRTNDGFICVLPYTTRHWDKLFELFGREDLKEEPRFRDFGSRREAIGELYALLARHLPERTTAAWLAAFAAADIPASPANTIDELLDDIHLQQTGFLRSSLDGRQTTMAFPVEWIGIEEPPGRATSSLSEDAISILGQVGFGPDEVSTLSTSGAVRLP